MLNEETFFALPQQVGEERERHALDQRFQRVLGLHQDRIHALELERQLILEQPSRNIEVSRYHPHLKVGVSSTLENIKPPNLHHSAAYDTLGQSVF